MGHAVTTAVFEPPALDALIHTLRGQGYHVIGPVARDGAIVYEEITTADDLPAGWGDTQEPGRYRLERRDDEEIFGYTAAIQSWKRYLFPPRETLWRAARTFDGFAIDGAADDVPSYAFLGVRACELRAIEIQDRVFLHGPAPDPAYAARRERALIIAVNCGRAASTCFCVSMDAGPRARASYDLALTELLEGGHRFLAESGSDRGASLLRSLPHRPARDADRASAEDAIARAEASMGREMDTQDLPGLLARNYENHRWSDVAARCLACTNCTLVCPTCFCNTTEDLTGLGGEAERSRRWDSCFTLGFTQLGGGTVRSSVRARYRQWLTHKLGTWHQQFGTSGCVGCGRCITWCPVGIDITEEVRAIRGSEGG